MDSTQSVPTLLQVVIDTPDARRLAEFYRALFGYEYRPGDEPPASGQEDPKSREWLVLRHPTGAPRIAFQQVEKLAKSTWPQPDVPQQLHLDTYVASKEELNTQHQRALQLGATLL